MRQTARAGVVAIGAVLALQVTGCAGAGGQERAPRLIEGAVDHHMHPQRQDLPPEVRAECEARGVQECPAPAGFDETGLIQQLDEAGLAAGVVLSRAFAATLRRPDDTTAVDHEAITAAIRARNEWVARAVARHPDRLIGFLGVDPLHPSAVPEVRHWGERGGLRGVKMQLSAAGLDLSDPAHVEQLRQVFRAAGEAGLAVLIHLRAFDEFGASQVDTFVEEVLPAAGGTPVQVAHLAGWGSGYDAPTAAALERFADDIASDDPRTRWVQFDFSAGVQRNTTAEQAASLTATMRRIGLDRFLFGSDFPGFEPEEMWVLIKQKLPLTPTELETLRLNRAFYLR